MLAAYFRAVRSLPFQKYWSIPWTHHLCCNIRLKLQKYKTSVPESSSLSSRSASLDALPNETKLDSMYAIRSVRTSARAISPAGSLQQSREAQDRTQCEIKRKEGI